MAEHKSSGTATFALPRFGQSFEADVLRKQQSSENRAPRKKLGIEEFGGTIFMRSEYVDASTSELGGNRGGNVNVEVKRGHATGSSSLVPPSGDEAQAECRRRALTRGLELDQLRVEFGVDFRAMVVVVTKRSMNFRERKVIVLAQDFLGRPTETEVVRNDLRNANAREPLEPGGFSIRGGDMGVVECTHEYRLARHCKPYFFRHHPVAAHFGMRTHSHGRGVRTEGCPRSALHGGEARIWAKIGTYADERTDPSNPSKETPCNASLNVE
jgi:hypothetical protein